MEVRSPTLQAMGLLVEQREEGLERRRREEEREKRKEGGRGGREGKG